MCDGASDFSGVKVGDKLWSVQLGECEVSLVDDDNTFYCENADDGSWFNLNGKCISNDDHGHHQSLFWSRPEIIAPPRPKRKMVKTVEAWANVYRGREMTLHNTWDDAKFDCGRYAGFLRGCVRITGTYEVEE